MTTVWEPKGVTAHIIPWNYPGQMFGRTVAPALAVGNACVVKPAEDACLCRCGSPNSRRRPAFPRRDQCRARPRRRGGRGALQPTRTSTSFRSPAASKSARWSRPPPRATISAARWSSAASRRRSCSPTPIWDAALHGVANAIVQNAGQTCSAGSRVLVERRIWDRFMADLADRFARLPAGHAGDGPRTRAGHLTPRSAHRRHSSTPPSAAGPSGWSKARSPRARRRAAFASKPASLRAQ